jgi:hypothetical protein
MNKTPALTGWLWLKEGFAFYRKQPAEVTTLFLSYMFTMFAISIIPVAGQILPLALMPAFSIAFMQACVQIEQGKRVYPNLLLAGFRSPGFPAQLQLGVLYLLAALIAMGATSLFDQGFFWKVITGAIPLNEKMENDGTLTSSMFIWTFFFTIAKLPLWYAAPLIAWQNMKLGKALFYSVVTVYRSLKTFLVYGLSCVLYGIVFPTFISVIVVSLLGKGLVSILILLTLSITLTAVMYCSFYPTYTYFFGKPEEPSTPLA